MAAVIIPPGQSVAGGSDGTSDEIIRMEWMTVQQQYSRYTDNTDTGKANTTYCVLYSSTVIAH